MKNILLIGGTYFLGKAFVRLMQGVPDARLTLLHRGSGNNPETDMRRSDTAPEGIAIAEGEKTDSGKGSSVREILIDRHDTAALKQIPHEYFDAVIDFCAYAKGDIVSLLENINADIGQYIFISTSDVYMRGLGKWLKEDAPLETRAFGGAAGEYISGKVSLEEEIAGACKKKGCEYTVLRPVFIFGPDNYAPRESMYFHWINAAGQILHPADAEGEFQLVYAGDVADSIKLVIGNPESYGKAFNICKNDLYTYDRFAELLKESIDTPFQRVDTDVATVNEKGIPLPFPLTKAESNYYDGTAIKELGLKYTDDVKAMRETYKSYNKN
ncbi:MAG: NAD-dependent epimerase/dehydratase family protein [Lachnospiraceae bacterium]|nr:NAD-dependent epimerase/dehydratase family protein [Lachnospiraceae bacterium]